MKEQSRVGSFVESIINVMIGYSVAVASQVIIFPFFGIIVDVKTNLWIALWFTAISIVRSFLVRRLFNAYQRSK